MVRRFLRLPLFCHFLIVQGFFFGDIWRYTLCPYGEWYLPMCDGANSFALLRAIETTWPKLWAFADHSTGVGVTECSPV